VKVGRDLISKVMGGAVAALVLAAASAGSVSAALRPF
jgi:hypothetical protein